MIKHHKFTDRTVTPAMVAYEVTRGNRTIGYVRRSQYNRGWCYTLDLDQPWTWIPGSTRHIATDHLLSAYSPMAAWLI